MTISIYDIAEKANVSPSTVSRALQDHPRIGDKTKQRIQALAKEMNYVPSTVARSLIANRTWTIGVVLATISDPFMGQQIEGVEQVALEAGFNVFLSTSQNDRQREMAVIEAFQQRRVDGIIVLASHLFERYGDVVYSGNIPVVVLNEQNCENIHCVCVDDRQGARMAVEHLLRLGHRRIAYVGIGNRPQSNLSRLQGYQDALAAANIAFDPNLTLVSADMEDDAKCGEAGLKPLLTTDATAVFCYNDSTAIGLLAACYQHGLVVPRDLSVIGFDDIEVAAYAIPPLTTIRQPRFEMGQHAMQMMLALLDGEEPANVRLSGELVVRQTTAPL